MKRYISLIVALLFIAVGIFDLSPAFAKARGGSKSGPVNVRGYVRKDGTYVQPHYRSRPDSNFNNNYSTKGNINPYTGKEGTKVSPSYVPSASLSAPPSNSPAPSSEPEEAAPAPKPDYTSFVIESARMGVSWESVSSFLKNNGETPIFYRSTYDDATVKKEPLPAPTVVAAPVTPTALLEGRVAKLESEIAALRRELAGLTLQLKSILSTQANSINPAPVGRTTPPLLYQGDARGKVLGVLGQPDSVDNYPDISWEIWHYGTSTVKFDKGVVSEWHQGDKQLPITPR